MDLSDTLSGAHQTRRALYYQIYGFLSTFVNKKNADSKSRHFDNN